MDRFITDFLTFQPNIIFVFGLFLLFGVLGGILSARLRWLPTITAFMLLGFIIGPHGVGLITKQVLKDSSALSDIAIGLILYQLGNMLHPREMLHSRRLMMMTLLETGFTFILVSLLMIALGYDFIISSIIGAIAVSSSPAVLVHVAEEMRAKGPVTDHVKSLVAMNNLVSFLLFSLVIPATLIRYHNAPANFVVITPVYQILGATFIGVIVAWLAIYITKNLNEYNQHYRFSIIVGAVMLTLGGCTMLETSALLGPLVLGIAIRWFESSKHNLTRVSLGEGGDVFYIILFVMAGAKINPALLLSLGFIPFLLVIIRILAKFVGVLASSRHNSFIRPQENAITLLLIPMAGMAIGLATTIKHISPELDQQVEVIVFAMVAIFETIGPFAAAYAFHACGEAGKATIKGKTNTEKE